MPRVLASETGLVVQRLIGLLGTEIGLMVYGRCRGLPDSEDTFKPVAKLRK